MALSGSVRSPSASNRLLAVIPPEDFERLAPHLESTPLPLGGAVYRGNALMCACAQNIAGLTPTLLRSRTRKESIMKTCEPQRRSLLRLMAAGGVTLCAPMMWGCKDKQQPASTAEKPPAATSSAPLVGSAKISQADAQYQGTPKADQKCGKCVQFIADSNSCKVVEGQVNAEGWCKLFAAKAG